MESWYYSFAGQQMGPLPEKEILAKIREGVIGPESLLWKDGMAEWLPLSRIADLNAKALTASPEALRPSAESRVSPSPNPSPLGHVPLPQPPAYHGNYVPVSIPNYMWQSVTATVVGLFFCCLLAMPFGIVAIVFASKVEPLRVQGDILGATTASHNAKTWMILSFSISALGLVMNVASMLLNIFHKA